MKKTSEKTQNFSACFNKKRLFRIWNYFFILIAAPLLFSGCAKTGFPQPPRVKPPVPPVIISVSSGHSSEKGLKLVYRYIGRHIENVRAFLIYADFYPNAKSVKKGCTERHLIAFQDMDFRNKFSLSGNKFFYRIAANSLKTGYYVLCVKAAGNFGAKSAFSNYKIAKIIILK